MGIEPIIKTKNVEVVYMMGKSNQQTALSGASLEIFPGEFVIFFGPSGCGKSTLLYSIAGLEMNARGSIEVFGNEVTTMKNKDLEKHHQKTIGMIFQAFYLIPSLTVLQNVMLPQIAINIGLKERKKKSLDLLNYFGVGSEAAKIPSELSGGQQQRVAISRALVNDPEIILADEPVGNLDSKAAQDTLKLIQELNLRDKKTIILVTHDPSHLDIANRIFYMKDGKIIDMKYNSHPRVISGTAPVKKDLVPADQVGKSDIELLLKTYEKEGPISGLLLEYKAKQIVVEALTGLTSEEVGMIEENVKGLLIHGTDDHDELISMLDKAEEKGGFAMDKRAALGLVERIKSSVKEMRLVAAPKINKASDIVQFVNQVRYYLLDALEVNISSSDSIDALNRIIKERFYGFTDRKGVRAVLGMPISEGGVGLDYRDARRISKMLELILLGRYSKNIDNTLLREIQGKVRSIVRHNTEVKK